MRILMLSWILTLLGLLISDRAIAVMIMEKKLSRLTPIDCEKYVYHPQCRGLQAKKRLSFEKQSNMMDEDGNDMIVENDGKPNICVCNEKTTNWTPLRKNKRRGEMFGRLGRDRALKGRNDGNAEERRVLSWNVISNGILNNNDIEKELDESKKVTVAGSKEKKKMADELNSSYVTYIFVYT